MVMIIRVFSCLCTLEKRWPEENAKKEEEEKHSEGRRQGQEKKGCGGEARREVSKDS